MANRRLAPAALQPADFAFTAENAEWANGQIAKYPEGRQASAVIPLLWKAQEQHGGWLPQKAIEAVADTLGMPHIRVLEVATFYTMFALEPVGHYWIQLCGTVPCDVCGAKELKAALEKRLGPPGNVSADGNFSWLEVECLGACCNAPMVQINQDYFEDLTPDSLNRLLDDLAAGRPVKVGSQTGRTSSEPRDAVKTLTDETLFDGSRVGAWRKRFAETQGAEAEATPPAAAAGKDDKPAAEAKKQDEAASSKEQVKHEKTPAQPDSGRAEGSKAVESPAERAAEGEAPVKRADQEAARERLASSAEPQVADQVGAPAPGSPAKREAAEEAAVEADRALRTEPPKQPLASGADDEVHPEQSPEERANAAGQRPEGLAAAREDRPDDLTKIKGIGPVNNRRLNDLGIWHFDQIAAWTPSEIAWVGAYLAFPGRIERENWVSQAAELDRAKG